MHTIDMLHHKCELYINIFTGLCTLQHLISFWFHKLRNSKIVQGYSQILLA